MDDGEDGRGGGRQKEYLGGWGVRGRKDGGIREEGEEGERGGGGGGGGGRRSRRGRRKGKRGRRGERRGMKRRGKEREES